MTDPRIAHFQLLARYNRLANAPAEAPTSDSAEPRGGTTEIRQALSATDLEMVRVLEDLIIVLIGSGIVKLTDLPKAAQDKLDRRLSLRAHLQGLDGIVGEADDIPLP